jgi:hypothetical protein
MVPGARIQAATIPIGPTRMPRTLDTMFIMLSQETLAEYRRMTPGERLELSFAMIRENVPYLLRGRQEVVERRFELLQRENDLRNAGILRGMARLGSPAGTVAR